MWRCAILLDIVLVLLAQQRKAVSRFPITYWATSTSSGFFSIVVARERPTSLESTASLCIMWNLSNRLSFLLARRHRGGNVRP